MARAKWDVGGASERVKEGERERAIGTSWSLGSAAESTGFSGVKRGGASDGPSSVTIQPGSRHHQVRVSLSPLSLSLSLSSILLYYWIVVFVSLNFCPVTFPPLTTSCLLVTSHVLWSSSRSFNQRPVNELLSGSNSGILLVNPEGPAVDIPVMCDIWLCFFFVRDSDERKDTYRCDYREQRRQPLLLRPSIKLHLSLQKQQHGAGRDGKERGRVLQGKIRERKNKTKRKSWNG